MAQAGSHPFNPFLQQEQAALGARPRLLQGAFPQMVGAEGFEVRRARSLFGLCSQVLAPGKTVGKGSRAPNVTDDSCGKSGCFSGMI